MKSFLKFLAVFLLVLLLSAALAPPLFQFLPFKFERIFNRLVMIFSLAAIVLFVRVRRSDFKAAGLLEYRGAWRLFLFCFLSGFAVLALLMAVKVKAGVAVFRIANLTVPAWTLRILKDLFTALLIAFLEESFFRGFIFGKLQTLFNTLILSKAKNLSLDSSASGLRMTTVSSAFITSLFYSVIHFIDGKRPFIGPHPHFWDSLRLMAAPFRSLSQWPSFWNEALGLFLFGVILNILFLRTRSLYAPIGLHAGCVFFVKLDGLFADSLNTATLFWGSSKMYDGLIGWSFLTAVGIFLFILSKGIGSSHEIP